MTDPTPTRAEVEALCAELRDYQAMMQDKLGGRAADLIQALRERAEAAERVIKAQDYDYGRAISERDAARRAEAAAWNDAIEAAGNLESIHGYSNAVPRHRIRALRRAAPTEGEA